MIYSVVLEASYNSLHMQVHHSFKSHSFVLMSLSSRPQLMKRLINVTCKHESNPCLCFTTSDFTHMQLGHLFNPLHRSMSEFIDVL